jgi:hypothetical protein
LRLKGGQKLPSAKKPEPWWFNLTFWDVISSSKVTQEYNAALLQKITHEFINARYPNRPKKPNDWMETCEIEGAKYIMTCHIDETNKKVVWKKITSTNKPAKKRHT